MRTDSAVDMAPSFRTPIRVHNERQCVGEGTPRGWYCQYRVHDVREIAMTRTYRMKVRAERHADTRRRILEAAVHLHRTGDAQRITITEVAKLAGVERPTVLRHFHDRISLLMACTFGDPVPAQHAADWAREPNPEARLALALTEQYAWYRRNRPALQQWEALTDDRLSASREAKQALRNRAYEVLSRGWAVDEADRPRLLM